jgi:2-polyprenyl-3-methyl-5-hydroxy-6-metoxy-1,4-benzoquinol methylase
MTPEAIVERIRQTLHREGSDQDSLPAAEAGVAPELAALQSGADIYHVPLRSSRPLIGRALTLARHTARRLLIPVLGQQVAYNLANAHAVARLKEDMDRIVRRQEDFWERLEQVTDEAQMLSDELLRAQQDRLAALVERFAREQQALGEQLRLVREQQELGERVAGEERALNERVAHEQQTLQELVGRCHEAIERMQADVDWARKTVQATGERMARTDRKLRRLLHFSSNGNPPESEPVPPATEPDFDYFSFESRFRGTEEEIKERQRPYVACYRGAVNILDIGCGRGEFLELLRDAGIPAKGVDADLDMVLACREKALDIAHDDALHFLENSPDACFGGVFAAQVIEHLEPRRMMELIRMCHRKLRAGGTIVLETINPQCAAGMNAFYLDPSHVRPVHPEMLRFFLESIDFVETRIRYSLGTRDGPDVSAMTDEWRRTNCGDYAAIARK